MVERHRARDEGGDKKERRDKDKDKKERREGDKYRCPELLQLKYFHLDLYLLEEKEGYKHR